MKTPKQRSNGANYYKKGSYNVICDYTGFKYKAEDTRMTWDGYRVGIDQWEARHPQDFITTIKEKQSVPNPRPRPVDNFVEPALNPALARVTSSLDVRITSDGEIRVISG